MIKKRVLTILLTISIAVPVFAATPVEKVSSADESSQFNSISLARGYKNLSDTNPCITQKFSADPCAMEYNGRVYVYSTNDGEASSWVGQNNDYGKITQLNCMSSSDMVNWTDHGTINAAGRYGAAKWAGNSWAPTACHKKINGKEKFFLYFANSSNGIGVLTSDSPTGPWIDPIGRPLISRSTPNCDSRSVEWLFDPAVLVDSDGTGYLYFGGGVPRGQDANPRTARVIKLGNDMTSIVGVPTTLNVPYLFEDSGINKVGNTYYYSYCNSWSKGAKIAYMTSNSPMGPFAYKGTCLDNPGVFFGTTGNNHHSIVSLKGRSYIVYHSEWLNKQMYGSQKGYRTTNINEISIGNGYISNVRGNLTGVSQVENVNPYLLNQAESIAWQGGIKVTGQGDTKVEMNRGDWIGVSNVDFGTGASSISMRAASVNGGVIKVCTDSPSGTAIGYVRVPRTGSNNNFTNVTANISNVYGTKKLFFVSSADVVIDSWQFFKNGSNADPNPTPEPNPQPQPQPTTSVSDGWYYIKNVNAQKYLQVSGNVGKAVQNVEKRCII
ncbi:glycoside hydrolase family 43 protein [Inconstantimicrobium porci]|uniref:glycoside hydrolase family 43 protein n=1 Tax=Inconstantimicrobium porci TaxID=2652291 RepID=UPI0024095F28|nr:glycoside hydrolase family 43 protein [Inconstantimicrobium porci]MDD6771972.1 glycoside hydrolase family 43 protein [Inconstantimicrobium porci]